jgi:hypothetical protein
MVGQRGDQGVTGHLVGADDPAAWHDALDRIPQRDVYFDAAYHRAYEAAGEGRASAFVYDDAGETFFHPFLTAEVDGTDIDVEGVYGYTGPIATTDDAEFTAAAWTAFRAWAREAGIVAEFVRFHPLLENDRLAAADMRVSRVRESVIVPLAGEPWSGYSGSQRRAVRRAQREGLVFEELDARADIGTFTNLYDDTMARLEAAPRYRFPRQYYAALADLGPRLRLFGVRRNERVVAAALVLVGDRWLHYHLGGSAHDARESRPNNLLFHEIAEWGRAEGREALHLGGGVGDDPDDSLLRFKSGFSRERRVVTVGTRVHRQERYDQLCDAWLAKTGRKQRPSYFMLYRLPR